MEHLLSSSTKATTSRDHWQRKQMLNSVGAHHSIKYHIRNNGGHGAKIKVSAGTPSGYLMEWDKSFDKPFKLP